MKKIAIIGGGLTGLSAAYELHRAGIEFELFEAEKRLGGYIKSSVRDSFLIEHGADSWIASKPWLEDLAREMGMADDIIASPAISPSTYILRNDKLLPLPSGLALFVPSDLAATDASPLFSAETKRRFHQELASPPIPLPDGADESVAEFVERHFGREVVEVLAAPLLAGVYGGDASRLSARAVIPGTVALEAQYGSLVRGVQKTRATLPASSGIFRWLRGGMESLVERLASSLPASSLRLSTRVLRIERTASAYSIQSGSGLHQGFEGVVVTTAVPAAAQLLGIALPHFEYSSAATVALAYDFIPQLPPGFGFLVASSQRSAIMAATFVHQKWPQRAPHGKALLRAFIADPTLLAANEEAVIGSAREALAQALGFDVEPMFAVVDRWSSSMPQYETGHLARVRLARERVAAVHQSRVSLAGNSYDGVSMPDAVRSGKNAARAVSCVPAFRSPK